MERKDFKNIYQKLHYIQERISGLGKDKSGMNYKYVTGDKVIGAIKPIMNDVGLILKQEVIGIENHRENYATKSNPNKSEMFSKVTMKMTWVCVDTGEKDENLWGANGMNDWDKGLGSALTYAERYFFLKYFHIATDEDDIDNPDLKKEDKAPLMQNTNVPQAQQPTPLKVEQSKTEQSKTEQPKVEQPKDIVKIPKASISGNTLLNDNIFKAMAKAVNSGNANQVKDALVKYRLDDVLKYVKDFEKIGFVIE